ncbi:MAG: Signal peptidase [Thermococcales archaeon 44_46]|uniref:A24 family peptidase C-terminal domain-containing protein n=1 Tax=Thermococcus sp. PK TaxID=913025 RepID=UPI0005B2880C|nr:A24 family peptidase C-terminal domain-containing protein [Thermococcus sp. PK]KUJ99210.1 MAG: Signal peptidase [Thermococcales archaeon 44_46]MDK2783215.1 archaeal preflagellin peptidase FlaK [Thermococcaceae archaeon]HIH73415.1 transposase [Thermococcaceae archaeon]
MEFLLIALGVIMGILTSYTDIKTGFIEDKHVFPIAGIGVLYYLYYGLAVKHDLFYAFSGLIGLAIGFLLGYLLYLMGGWASGDVVILMGYSALFPYASSYAKIVPPYAARYPLHSITLLFNSILAVFPFIFFYSLAVLVVRRRTTRLKEVFLDKWPKPFEVALWVSAAFVVLGIVGEALPLHFGVLIWAITIAILAKLQKVGDVVGILLFAYGAFETPEIIYSYLKLAATFYAFKVFFSLVKVLREEVLTKRVTVDELKEWDILGEWIYEKDGKIYRDRESSFDKLVRALRTLDLNALRVEYDKLIASPTAEGLKKEDLETLKALVNEGALENEFLVRNAMPFAPALFLGFLISVFYGDLFWWLVLKSIGL